MAKIRLTPVETIRAYCLHCNGGNDAEVRRCDTNKPGFRICPFHPFRMGRGRPSVKFIHKFCLQCMGESPVMVRECETTDCLIYTFRMGKNPARAGKGQSAGRMAAVRLKKQAVSLKFTVQNQRSVIG